MKFDDGETKEADQLEMLVNTWQKIPFLDANFIDASNCLNVSVDNGHSCDDWMSSSNSTGIAAITFFAAAGQLEARQQKEEVQVRRA